MNLYGHAGQWLMLDCGITFNSPLCPEAQAHLPGQHKHDVVAADPKFISQRKEDLAGIVITHAHEDHLGALPYLWRRFKCPVYTTKYTAEILRRKLARGGLGDNIPIIEIDSGQRIDIGPFNVEWLPITHSLPEAHAFVIRTEAGNVFHTADWKIDLAPVTDNPFNAQPFKLLSKQNILAMVCDSTNATRAGYSVSEQACYQGLKQAVEGATGRVVVGCFSSNIARLIILARIAKETGRYFSLLGRSLQNTVGAAKATGHWPDDLPVLDAFNTGYLLPEEVLAVATGSQGEPRAALNQLAKDTYRDVSLDEGDWVVFSSIVIPGNEKPIENLLKAFKVRKIHTLTSEDSPLPIHASGHPCQEELKQMYNWVRPDIAVPTHGEAQHLKANAEMASQSHVPQSLTGLNGDLFKLAPEVKLVKQAVKAGRVPLQQN
ncbi:ribonuclease J [Paraglaciecola marina]|uniref:ribonuclease J n=1 Tax=Paraglaciecola marina TaxID=2500157 RepID=UPI00105B7B4F|nr:ribonuclease J [Paraglaciecola marina]